MAAPTLPRERRKGESTVRYDLRPFLAALDVVPSGDGRLVIRMTLRHDPERGVGRPDEVLAALAEQLGTASLRPEHLVRESLVLADPPRDEPAKRVAGRRPLPERGPAPRR